MPKQMQVDIKYQQIKGTRQSSIQFEFKCSVQAQAIKQFLCLFNNREAGPQQEIENIPHAAFFAQLVYQVQNSVILLKSKKDTPVQVDFGVYNDKFIITALFMGDNASFKQMCKLMIDQLFSGKTGFAYNTISKHFASYLKGKDKEDVVNCMLSVFEQVACFVTSKQESKAMQPMILKCIKQEIDKKDLKPAQDPFKLQMHKPTDKYFKTCTKSELGPVIFTMTVTSLAMQNVNFVVYNDQLFIKKGELLLLNRQNCKKFIKDRLAFTAKKRNKQYQDLTDEQKKKTNATDYKNKQSESKQKKMYLLTQVVFSSAGCLHEMIPAFFSELTDKSLDALEKPIQLMFDDLTEAVKAK